MFQKLVSKSKEGCEDSTLKIIKNLKPLIISSIFKYYNRRELFDDLVQDGILEILEAIKDYDENKEVYFLGYIKLRLKYFYLNKDNTAIDSLNEKVFIDGYEEKIDILVDEDINILEDILKLDENIELYKSYELLSKREKEVIDLYYIDGLNMKEISKKMNLAYRTVINTKVNAINRLRGNFDI